METEAHFARMHAQDGSPRQVANKRVIKLRKLRLTNSEIFKNLKRDFAKHFSDQELREIVNYNILDT